MLTIEMKKKKTFSPKANSKATVDLYSYVQSTSTHNRYQDYGIYSARSCSEHSRLQCVEGLRLLKQSKTLALTMI